VQRVGLDGVGEAAAKPVLRPESQRGEDRPAGDRNGDDAPGLRNDGDAERRSGRDLEENLVHSLRSGAHRGDERAADRSDDGGDDRQAAFAPAHERAHPKRERPVQLRQARCARGRGA
jgi:hypothetical protein